MGKGLVSILFAIGINGYSQPIASFDFSTLNPGNICESGFTTCNNTSTGATSYYWEMPGCVPPSTSTGSDPGFVTYDTPGIYTITLHAINGVDTSTVSHDLEVHPKPGTISIIGAEDLCIDYTVTLSVPPGPWTYFWWFRVEDSWMTDNVSSVDVTEPGSYWSSFQDSTTTCNVETDTVIIIDGTPTPVISWGGGSDLVSNYATGNQWYLDAAIMTGETNQVLTVTMNGTYTVEVTGTNGCVGTSADYIVTNVGVDEWTNPNLTIFKNGVLSSTVVWTLYDLSGQIIMKGSVGEYELPKGVFLLSANNEVKKLVNY